MSGNWRPFCLGFNELRNIKYRVAIVWNLIAQYGINMNASQALFKRSLIKLIDNAELQNYFICSQAFKKSFVTCEPFVVLHMTNISLNSFGAHKLNYGLTPLCCTNNYIFVLFIFYVMFRLQCFSVYVLVDLLI